MGLLLASLDPKPTPISIQAYRVGPPRLRPLPLEAIPLVGQDIISNELGSKLLIAAQRILRKYYIREERRNADWQKDPNHVQFFFEYNFVENVRRCAPGELGARDNEHLALLKSAQWNESFSRLWGQAVEELRPKIQDILIQHASEVYLDIEMISAHIGFRKYFSKHSFSRAPHHDVPEIER